MPGLHLQRTPLFSRLIATLWLGIFLSLRLALAAGTYPVVPAFNGVQFQFPVQVVFAPGETARAFVVELPGRIALVPDVNLPSRKVILDLSSRVQGSVSGHGLFSMVCHPRFAQNGFFYLWTSIWENNSRYLRLLRFTLSPDGTVDPASELTLFSQAMGAGGHDGGTLLFGPDGYLYLSIGDGIEGQTGAEAAVSQQRIDRGFLGAVLRIDVDQRPENLVPNPHLGEQPAGYRIPADNPFVGATSFNGEAINPSNVRTEFWAVGLRNPFRMSFDPANGDLWVADVGLNLREELNVITRGGNYGWPFLEGTSPGPNASAMPAGVAFVPPVWQNGHGAGDVSIIGGVVCRESRIAALQGQYVFTDYVTGRIWAAGVPASRPFQDSQVVEIASAPGIVGITLQPGTGDILLANLNQGIIQRLDDGGSPPANPSRLLAISTRGFVGTGSNVLIGGFIVAGPSPKTVLIRASGPALVPFLPSGTLPDPQLRVFNSAGVVIEANSGWGGSPLIAKSAAASGAMAWPDPASADSAVVATLPPGAYTAQVSSVTGKTGTALVEVYEVP